MHDLAGVGVNPLDLVLQTINELLRQTRRKRLRNITRLRIILLRVIFQHVKHDEIRVQSDVVVRQTTRLHRIPHTSPCLVSVHVRFTGVVIGVERRDDSGTINILGRHEQPIPVDVLRQIVCTTTRRRNIVHPATVVSCRRNSIEQVIRDVRRPIREAHLSTSFTGKIRVDQPPIVVATIIPGATEGALKLQGVVTVLTNSGLYGLSDPLILALFGNLALNPVLHRSFFITAQASTIARRNRKTKILLSLVAVNLAKRVVRQVRAVDLHVLRRHIRLVVSSVVVPTSNGWQAIQIPVNLARNLTIRIHAGLLPRSILHRRIQIVHHIVLRLLTKRKTSIHKTIRTNKVPHTSRELHHVAQREQLALTRAVELGEHIRIRVLCPNTELLTLRKVRVSVKVTHLAQGIHKRLHTDGETTIGTSRGGVDRRGSTITLNPLRVNTHTLHRNRLQFVGTRVHRHVAVALVNDITLNGVIRTSWNFRLDSAINLDRLITNVVLLLANTSLVDPISVLARVQHTIALLIRLTSLVLRPSKRSRSKLRSSHRLRQRRNQRK